MKAICKIGLGLMLIVTVVIGYLPCPEYLVELTCMSNTLGGILLLVDGILDLRKKKGMLPLLYLTECSAIMLVFLVCTVSLATDMHFNFEGAFFFLHVINPIAFFICYMCFVNNREQSSKLVLAAPTFAMLYFIFDYVLGNIRGKFVYGFVEPGDLNLVNTVITGIILYVFIYLLALAIFYLNRLLSRFLHAKDRRE